MCSILPYLSVWQSRRGRGWVSQIFVRRWRVLSLLSLICILWYTPWCIPPSISRCWNKQNEMAILKDKRNIINYLSAPLPGENMRIVQYKLPSYMDTAIVCVDYYIKVMYNFLLFQNFLWRCTPFLMAFKLKITLPSLFMSCKKHYILQGGEGVDDILCKLFCFFLSIYWHCWL